MNRLTGHFYANETANLADYSFTEKESIVSYIENNEDYRKLKQEKYFRVCACNLEDVNAPVFKNKPITLLDPFGFFTIEGFKLLITVAKTIENVRQLRTL
jgi:hypothetical protein